MEDIVESHKDYLGVRTSRSKTGNKIQFWTSFVGNLKFRVGSFNERLQNEIGLVISLQFFLEPLLIVD
jgi:hypothetical protein